jgi:predicted amidophosphoribosyltransferase
MFCPQCGKEVKDGAKFCENCGWAVPAAPVQNVQPVVLPSAMPTATPTAMPQNPNTGFVQTIAADEKHCPSCGSVIKKIAEICPKCGVRQNEPVRFFV